MQNQALFVKLSNSKRSIKNYYKIGPLFIIKSEVVFKYEADLDNGDS